MKKINIEVVGREFPYISFDEAFKLAENMKKLGGVATIRELGSAIGRKKTGWFGLQVASMRRWGLVSGQGKMKLTDVFQRIASPRSPNDDLKAKQEAFMEIPLFKEIFEKYSKHGLPEEPYLSNVLQSDYLLKPRYAVLVSGIIREFISKYFSGYGTNQFEEMSSSSDILDPNEGVRGLKNILSVKKNIYPINIHIISPIGNFNLKASNKTDFGDLVQNKLSKIWEAIDLLWREDEAKNYTDEKQEDGAQES